MTKLNKIFFLFLLLSLKISNQLPTGKVINTCGKLGYDPPSSASDCVEIGEYCCFLRIQNTKDPNEAELKFCVSSPSDIDESDVKSEIEKYKREIRLITINCDILWANEIKIDKIMGMGLED